MITKDEGSNIRPRILLSLQRALLGVVTPNLRGVSVGWSGDIICGIFVYDGPPTELEIELVAVAETEAIALLPEKFSVKFDAVASTTSDTLEKFFRGAWVFSRHE